jgi:ubiquinone/menaquinone biosynthesis C-methylase UbiE
MGEPRYIHGHERAEQERLVAQADFWAEKLVLPGLRYRAGQRLLEVGCGVGAVLGVIGSAFPGLDLAGIDIAPEQVDYACGHLERLGLTADLRVGDARSLPWPDASFDHVYMMWFLEHVADPQPFLAEVHRVLAPGGTITINETDYSMFLAWPASPEIEYLAAAQRALFEHSGNPMPGRALGALLVAAGFHQVSARPIGFHHFTGSGRLRDFADYLLGFLEPMVPRMVELGFDQDRLSAGVAAGRALPDLPAASLTQIVFRAQAVR